MINNVNRCKDMFFFFNFQIFWKKNVIFYRLSIIWHDLRPLNENFATINPRNFFY